MGRSPHGHEPEQSVGRAADSPGAGGFAGGDRTAVAAVVHQRRCAAADRGVTALLCTLLEAAADQGLRADREQSGGDGESDLWHAHGRETRACRSCSTGEVQQPLAVAGSRKVVHLTAVLTGLRRGELGKLKWADVQLDGPAPFILVRGANARNHKEERQPLHTDLVVAWRELRGPAASPSGLVFAKELPRMKRSYADLKVAGISPGDPERGSAGVHSLRSRSTRTWGSSELATRCAWS